MDIAHQLNRKLRQNPLWRKLAEATEDLINATIGNATDESINANGSPHRFLRGDTVDPRGFTDIEAVTDNGLTLPQMIEGRDRKATVRVVLPTDDNGGAQLYMEMDGTLYVASTKRFHQRDMLINEAKYLGFDFFSDDLSDADYARVLEFIGDYWPRAGSHDALAKFMGFIRDIRIDLIQLWTVDDGLEEYEVLDRFNKGMTPIWDGGKFYPTFHYDLYYDAFSNTDVAELKRLFFALAPIHLVLRRMVETIRSTGVAYASAGPVVSMGEAMFHLPQTSNSSRQVKYKFVNNTINLPMPLVPPNLKPNGIAIAASGPHGVWVIGTDPFVANPGNPAQYVLDNGLYIPPSEDPNDRFDFPPYGLWDSGLWFMAQVPTVGLLVEIT